MAELARIRWVSSSRPRWTRSSSGTTTSTALLWSDRRADGSLRRSALRGRTSMPTTCVAFAGGDLGRSTCFIRRFSSPIVGRRAVRIAARARDEPSSSRCHVLRLPSCRASGLALQAVGGGSAPLHSSSSTRTRWIIHLENTDGHELAWHPADRLEAGFVSPTPEGLGGVGWPGRDRAGCVRHDRAVLSGTGRRDRFCCGSVSPGIVSTGARQVRVEVAGQLRDALPQNAGLRRFVVRTAPVPYAN